METKMNWLFPEEPDNFKKSRYESLVMAMRGDVDNHFNYPTFSQWREAFNVPDNYQKIIDLVLTGATGSSLTPRQIKVLRMSFGFERDDHSCFSQIEMAHTFGVTKERIRQIRAKSLRILGHHFNKLNEPVSIMTEKAQAQEFLSTANADDAIESLLELPMIPMRTVRILKQWYEITTIGDLEKIKGYTTEKLMIEMPRLGAKAATGLTTVLAAL